ncbi:MAG: hypothetical protein C5B55_05140 [Blastocatellia bacterium]|nr:MAG: hypothetical protein C5B55_05140 [Blastocatellia bacterium]
MYQDDYGRTWEGPHPFTLEMIQNHAPREFGVYEILYSVGMSASIAYIGIATGDTIRGRLTKHRVGIGNWALARLGNTSDFTFVFYRCDGLTAKQIESHVVTMNKPPFNVRQEYRHFIPSIAVH